MFSARIPLCLAALVLSACAPAPRESFYTLNPTVPGLAPQLRNTADAFSVSVGPVRIPEIVDRPQLVIRKGPGQVDILEQHRWAQSLRTEIA